MLEALPTYTGTGNEIASLVEIDQYSVHSDYEFRCLGP